MELFLYVLSFQHQWSRLSDYSEKQMFVYKSESDYWKNVLSYKGVQESMKKNINIKLLKGLNNI